MDPYQQGLIPSDIYFSKRNVGGKIVSIMNAYLNNRQLKLIDEPTRAFRKYDLVEIIATKEKRHPGETVNSIAYVGFIEIKSGGIIRVSDKFKINERTIGKVIGFDATHFPNHYNLIIHVTDLATGYEIGLNLEDKAEFIYHR